MTQIHQTFRDVKKISTKKRRQSTSSRKSQHCKQHWSTIYCCCQRKILTHFAAAFFNDFDVVRVAMTSFAVVQRPEHTDIYQTLVLETRIRIK